MRKNFKKVLLLTLVLLIAISMFVINASAAETNDPVAEVGGKQYETLADAITNATSGQTIYLLKDCSDNVTLASGKNITIDGNDFTYTGKISLTNGDGNTITVKNATLSPTGNFSIHATNSTAYWNIVIDDCVCISQTDRWNTDASYAVAYGTQCANTAITIKNSEISGFYYPAAFSQGGKGLTVENCEITDCVYLVSAGKCDVVAIKGVTYSGEAGMLMKGEGNAKTLKLEDTSIKITNETYPYALVYIVGSTSIVTADVTGVNSFVDATGTAYKDLTWTNLPVAKLNVEAQNGTKFGDLAAIAKDAKSGETVTLLKDYDGEAITLPEGVELDANGKDGADKITVVEPKYVAQIGEVKYATLQAAMVEANKVAGNYTITLLDNCAEEFTFAQNAGVNITIDGGASAKALPQDGRGAAINDDGFVFSGKITLANGGGSLTFTNMKIVAPGQMNSTIAFTSPNNQLEAPDLKFYNCILTFDGVMNYTSIVSAAAVSKVNHKVEFLNCTASNLTDLYTTDQNGSTSLIVENCVATNMTRLVRPMKCLSVTIKNVTYSGNICFEVTVSNQSTLALENVTINTNNSSLPMVLMNAPDAGVVTPIPYIITLKGENIFTKKNVEYTDNSWILTANDARCPYEIKNLNAPPVAEVDGIKYPTLAAALAAAKEGETVVLLEDVTLENVVVTVSTKANITLDLNGYKLTGKFTEKTTAFVYVTGGCALTIKDSSADMTGGIHAVDTNGNLSNLIRVETDATLLIKNGNFTQDASVNGSGMIDSRGDEIITVNGGNFYLENIGTASNGSPWIFNASSQNTKNIIVNGGTFNADILHQYYPFEVMTSEKSALKNNGDGTWTMVNAVAWVNEYEKSGNWYENKIGYATIEEAIAAALKYVNNTTAAGATSKVTLLADVEIKDAITVDKNIVIDAGTYSIGGQIVLANVDAIVKGGEGFNVTSGVADYEVVYANGEYSLAEAKRVAKIGDVEYKTLAAALAAAKAGDTITFLADVNENVTISKNLTIDGDNFKYTGTMTANAGLNVTVQNVNFVNGGFDKPKAQKSTTGTYTIKYCTFDGNKTYAYSFRFYGANNVIIENCTVKDYVYSFLYIASGTNNVSVKNVTVENCPNYAVYFASGVNNATVENLKVKNSNNGFIINNTANRTFTIKDCEMVNVITAISESKGTNAITCTALGANDFGTATLSQYATIVLGAADATLKASENANVTTDVAGYVVKYVGDTHKLVEAVAKIGDTYYETLQEAIDAAQSGDEVVLLQNIDLAKTELGTLDNSYDTYFLVKGKSITVDLNGKTISGAYTGKMLVGVFSTDNNGHLILTGNGTIDVTATGKVYCLIANYEDGCSITIENGTYKLDKASDSLIYSGSNYGDNQGVLIENGNFTLGNVGAGSNGSPWIFNVLGQNTRHVIVVGGTYNADVYNQHYIWEVQYPDGEVYASKKIDEKTWTIVEAVAYITRNKSGYDRYIGYATFAEALAAAKDGETIKLLEDLALTETLTVEKPVTIDANGFSINGDDIVLANADATVMGAEGFTVTTNIAYHVVVYADGVYKAIDTRFEIDMTNTRFGSDFSLLFAFNKDKVANIDTEGMYAVVTHKGETYTYNFEDWNTLKNGDKNYYVIEYTGIAAKEMGDEITIVIFDADGNIISVSKTMSIRKYAEK